MLFFRADFLVGHYNPFFNIRTGDVSGTIAALSAVSSTKAKSVPVT